MFALLDPRIRGDDDSFYHLVIHSSYHNHPPSFPRTRGTQGGTCRGICSLFADPVLSPIALHIVQLLIHRAKDMLTHDFGPFVRITSANGLANSP